MLSSALEEMAAEIDDLQTALSTANTNATSDEQHVQALQAQLDQTTTKLKSLQSQLRAAHDRLAQLNAAAARQAALNAGRPVDDWRKPVRRSRTRGRRRTARTNPMTTERVLPAIALPSRDGAAAQVEVAGSVARSGAHPGVGRQPGTFSSMPSRAGILIGASAAVYAVTLAAVAGFQAADDSALSSATSAVPRRYRRKPRGQRHPRGCGLCCRPCESRLQARMGRLAERGQDLRGTPRRPRQSRRRGTWVDGRAAEPDRPPERPGACGDEPGRRSSAPKPVTKTRASGG